MVLMCELAQLYRFRHIIFDRVPYLIPGEINMAVPILVWIVAVAMLALGLFTRAAAIFNYALSIVVFGTTSTYEYHMDYIYLGINFLLMFAPLNSAWSLDNLLRVVRDPPTDLNIRVDSHIYFGVYQAFIFVGLALVYADSVFHKLASEMWRNGLGVWLPGSIPVAAWSDATWILNHQWAILLAGYITFVFEALFIFAMWFRSVRPVLLIIGVGLHVGILAVFPIPFFALGVLSLYCLLVPPNWWDSFAKMLRAKTPRITMYYDPTDSFQYLLAIIVRHFDVRHLVAFRLIPANGKTSHPTLESSQSFSAISISMTRRSLLRTASISPLGVVLYCPGAGKILAAVSQLINVPKRNCDKQYVPLVSQSGDSTYSDVIVRLMPAMSYKDICKGRIWLAFLTVLLAVQSISTFESPVAVGLSEKFGGSIADLHQSVIARLRPVPQLSRQLLGLTKHGVFMDAHFKKYDHIYSVVHIDTSGQRTWLPIVLESGQPGSMQSGRIWVRWSFRAVRPCDEFDFEGFNQAVQDYTADWLVHQGYPFDNQRFVILAKELRMPLNHKNNSNVVRWEPNLLQEQMNHPWQEVAQVRWSKSDCTVTWDNKVRKDMEEMNVRNDR